MAFEVDTYVRSDESAVVATVTLNDAAPPSGVGVVVDGADRAEALVALLRMLNGARRAVIERLDEIERADEPGQVS